MQFDARELIVIELALIRRKEFLESIRHHLPGAQEKLEEVQALLAKIRKEPIGDIQLDDRIDLMHGPGSAAALDAAVADGSIFSDSGRADG